jgi:peptidoglycan/xylan/chitin deacetylase (PgdA/CDA1 family)
MNKVLLISASVLLSVLTSCRQEKQSWIRINQLGYRPADMKTAVYISKRSVDISSFKVIDAGSGKEVKIERKVSKAVPLDQFVSCYRLAFSGLRRPGRYRIVAGGASSPDFVVADSVYIKTADFLLTYMRQQRCGYNPYLKDSCHTQDGYELYGKGDSAHVDVVGGWHDAADYLQYVTTSANAVYQMLFAYSENRNVFGDKFNAAGLPSADGSADVLNESRWGLDWLIKMNPRDGVMYNQVADDRDHVGFRYPVNDPANYGKGTERPVYLCTGKPQGALKYMNRATGIASTAGKFASAFARGSLVFRNSDPAYAELLKKKAIAAFEYGLENPGVCQTAPGSAPYFYEEDNWTDDMELAASELFTLTGAQKYLLHARKFGRQEHVTPWIGSDTARHYQWYPFVNMGHPGIAREEIINDQNEFAGYMKQGIELTLQKARKNPFLVGVPFIWCSNNLVAGILTQMHLYSEITGDSTYAELEAAHRDWLFGCNPWGTSMIVGLPEKGDFPKNSHSSYVIKGEQVYGGLVDGPVYSTIFRAHSKYVSMKEPDEYAEFQTRMANYHDDIGDYTSNECTMDGTASLVYYLSALGLEEVKTYATISHGAITRMDQGKKEVWLCFTAHEFNDGFGYISSTLKKHRIKASFFLTGEFCRASANDKTIRGLITDGHYVAAHSDKHLLYCDWNKRDSLLVTKNQFVTDLSRNYEALGKFGVTKGNANVFLPPYEWYNDTISKWTKQLGLLPVNISSGTKTSQDWTFPAPGAPYYKSNDLVKDLFSYEEKKGLNGYILLIHPGTDPRRKDKLYLRLDSIITELEKKNYKFRSFSEI